MASLKRYFILLITLLGMLLVSSKPMEKINSSEAHSFHSPVALVVDPTAENLYIAEQAAQQIEVLDITTSTIVNQIDLSIAPTGMTISPNGDRLYITGGAENGELIIVKLPSSEVTQRISVGHTPLSPVVSEDGASVYVANRFDNTVAKVAIDEQSITAGLSVSREPVSLALSTTHAKLVVAHHLPDGAANTGNTAAAISLIDTTTFKVVQEIQLPDGSTGVRGVTISPDGNFAYVTHILAHYKLPTTQLDRGWIVTNGVSVIDIQEGKYLNTFLLDDVYQGAANPWAIAVSDDGKYLLVTHAGTHEISVIDRIRLHERLSDLSDASFSETPADVPYDLGFLSGIRERLTLAGNGPRALAVEGNDLYVAEFFSDSLSIIRDLDSTSPTIETIAPDAPEFESDRIRQGEMIFNDAQHTYQGWLSCATCHPDGRSDALNWDLGNDGLGSPRNAKSLLHAHVTPPAMITGIRADAATAVRAGLKFIEFSIRPEDDALLLDEYLQTLTPVESPYLQSGELSPAARRGQGLYEQAGCASCHHGPYATDLASYDVGTGLGSNPLFDTPSLIEVWRTAPYLQDGRAATMLEVFTTYNSDDKHGITSVFSEDEINDLVEYVLSR